MREAFMEEEKLNEQLSRFNKKKKTMARSLQDAT